MLRDRRRFLSAAAWAAATPLFGQETAKRKIAESDPANMKLCHRVDARGMTDDDLRFFQQIGLEWLRLEFPQSGADFDALKAARDRLAAFKLRIYSAVHPAYRSLKVQLGQPGRDQDIETYCQFLRDLGKLQIPVASYDFHPANTYTTRMVQYRGYSTREFDVDDFRSRVEKRQFDREYSADEIWANYTYFMKATLPVAEQAGVKMALHPDDPPLAKMNGVAKLFTHYDGYRRAEQIAGKSPNWGLTFCVGTWLEGGDRMGKDVFQMIRDFGGRGKIFEVHFRNVTGPLPRFNETFPDDGYADLYQVIKALRQVKFSGGIEPDHVPRLLGDAGVLRAGTAYCIACMRAMLRRANEEVG
jgi:mannonate dehydratase